MRSLLIILGLVVALSFAFADKGRKTLVVLEENSLRVSHSTYLNILDEHFDVTVKLSDDDDLKISSYGEFLYDNVVLFVPSIEEFGGALSVKELLDFVDHGGNVILAADADLTSPLRDLAKGFGVQFDVDGTKVFDHINYDAADSGDHSLVYTSKLVKNDRVVGSESSLSSSALLYRGIAHTYIRENSDLLVPVVRGESSAYTYKPTIKVTKQPLAAGQSTLLVSALQARNNARAIISGSLEMFSDKFMNVVITEPNGEKRKKSSNLQIAKELTLWCFTGRGLLKATNIHHARLGESAQPHHYRIRDDMEFHVDMSEWNGEKWTPFVASDLQLEITRLDPHIRVNLHHDGKGHYHVSTRLPDVYGMFTFRLYYHHIGFSHFESSQVVGIHPYRHDEYERFIFAAYPYYASALSMLVLLAIFSFVFLWNKEPVASPKVKTN